MEFKVIHYPEVESTNLVLRSLLEQGAPEGTVVVADRQTKGRGRMGKEWYSSHDFGLWFSVLLRPGVPCERGGLLGLAAALAVVSTLRDRYEIPATLKWPNDVQVNGLKVSGILPESGLMESRLDWVVLGIGVNMTEPNGGFPEDLRSTAAAISAYTHSAPSKDEVLRAILSRLSCFVDDISCDRWKDISARANRVCSTLGRTILIVRADSLETAYALRITDTGGLLVSDEEGRMKELISGEVSVRTEDMV